jgi:hypothetical protein
LFAVEYLDGMNEPADPLQVCPREAASLLEDCIKQRLLAYFEPFGRLLRDKPFGSWWFVKDAEVYFDQADTSRLSVAGWRCDRVPEQPMGNPVRIRPDWICQIYSADRSHNRIKNKRVYHHHGVPHYWIIDPVERLLFANRWSPEGYIEVHLAEYGETVYAEPFEMLPFSLGMLFGEDEDESQGEAKAETKDETAEKTD